MVGDLLKPTTTQKVAVFVCCLMILGCGQSKTSREYMLEARRAMRQADYSEAERSATKVSADDAKFHAAMMLAAEACTKDQRPEDALQYYDTVINSTVASQDTELAKAEAADLLLAMKRLTECETRLLQLINANPGSGFANSRLALLYSMTGQQWDSAAFYETVVRGGIADYQTLAIAADLERMVSGLDITAEQVKQSADPLVKCAYAAETFLNGRTDATYALEIAVDVTAHQRTDLVGMLGEQYADAENRAQLKLWYAKLSTSARNHPRINFVLGKWLIREGQQELAEWCFRKTLEVQPVHRRATYQLAKILTAADHPDAVKIRDRANKLIELSRIVDQVLRSEGHDATAYQRVTVLLVELGRIWEACAWSVEAKRLFNNPKWASEILEQHGKRLNSDLPYAIVPDFLRADQIGDHEKQLVEYFRGQTDEPTQQVRHDFINPTFEQTSLIDFRYLPSHDTATVGARSFEQTGGGALVVDLDNDSWPDIVFPQGVLWETGSTIPTPDGTRHDAFFRNRFGTSFQDVSSKAAIADEDFSQGGSVADLDNDGFDDLYIANIGTNRLLQNMGDGTFVEISETKNSPSADEWTVSTLACDLNNDGLTDLLDVNYLQGEDLYTRICDGVACSPSEFQGAADRILVNNGRWQFDQSKTPLPQQDAKGLGVIGFYRNEDTVPTIFVANDQVANFLLTPTTETSTDLQNAALENGVAYNEEGLAMACMGVAIDDWNRDGLQDIFVTNFFNEPNTMYLQDSFGLFSDVTRHSGLANPSYTFTGWGTQSFDANLDGWPDLVVANGHVDDYRPKDGPYKMRPQFYVNRRGVFSEVSAEQCGDWFFGEYLGRGLAKLDWNKDGRTDFVLTLLADDVALLKNTTQTTGRFVTFSLKAVQLTRNAFAARLQATYKSGEVIRQQVTAGGGYMAENERTVQFAVPDGDDLISIHIQWPSGKTTVLQNPPEDQFITVIESRDTAYLQSSNGQHTTLPVLISNRKID